MNHHIHKLTIEFTAPDFPAAREKQAALNRWAKSELLWNAANEVLDAHDLTAQVIRIPRLEIEVNIENEEIFQQAFLTSLNKNLQLALSNIQYPLPERQSSDPDQENSKVLSFAENAFQAMIYFLKNGVLPWFLPPGEHPQFNIFFKHFMIHATQEQVRFLQKEVIENPVMFRRLYAVFGADKMYDFIHRHLIHDSKTRDWAAQMWNEIQVGEVENLAQKQFLKMLFCQTETINPGNWNEFKKNHLLSDRNDQQAFLFSSGNIEKSLYIPNAGIVLMAPYFEQLFQVAGLIENRQFRSPVSRERAIMLLQYLVDGDEEPWEYKFPVFKVLCGYPLEMPVDTTLQLNSVEKHICDELLQFAISQWTIMRNSSLKGLRDSFLKRPGKLWQKEDDTWRLIIEKKTEDVLMERLPSGWSFSMLKFPWMPQILYVEW